MKKIRAVLSDLWSSYTGLFEVVDKRAELAAVKLTLFQVGWRKNDHPGDDVRELAEAWVDAERRAAAAEREVAKMRKDES